MEFMPGHVRAQLTNDMASSSRCLGERQLTLNPYKSGGWRWMGAWPSASSVYHGPRPAAAGRWLTKLAPRSMRWGPVPLNDLAAHPAEA